MTLINYSSEPFTKTSDSVFVTKAFTGLIISVYKMNDNNSVDEEREGKDDQRSWNSITTIPDDYRTRTRSHEECSTSVNLGPFREGLPIPPEDENIMSYYESLQYILYETGYPETVDRTNQPISVQKDEVSICILSSPVQCMSILMEGSRRCPGNSLLVLSTTWLSKMKSETREGLCSLYVHKAIAFGLAGRTFLETYKPPRRVTYFVNFFTKACTDGQRHDGMQVEADLDCPMSSSMKLTRLTDDNLWTRGMMSKAGLAFPATVAFVYNSDMVYPNQEPDVSVVHVEQNKTNLKEIVDAGVRNFLERCAHNEVKMIAVKPSGVMWNVCSGVSFHWSHECEEIISDVMERFDVICQGDGVLVETFIETIKPNITANVPGWACTDTCAVRMRSIVCRNHDDTPVTTNISCGLNTMTEPVHEDNSIPHSLNTTLVALGVCDETEVARFEEDVRQKGAALLERIICHENDLGTAERGGLQAQSDVIGIDFVITRKNGVLTPVAFKVKSHDCMTNCQIYENVYTAEEGISVGPWVQTMIARSQKYVLAGKKILVIGAGGYNKAFIWPAAQDMGVKVMLVDANPDHFAAEEVSEFIYYDFSNHYQDDSHAVRIYQLLKKKNKKVDGCLTFWEDCVPLAAKLCKLFNLKGPSIMGAMNAKNKSSTLSMLRKKTVNVPNLPRTYLYTSWFTSLRGKADLENVIKMHKFPLVMKLEYGSSAVGVVLVKNAEELEEKYLELSTTFQKDEDYFGIGLGHGNTVMVMEYIGGTEHDVDLIIFEGRLVAAFVSDNGPTRDKTFTETAACMPSSLPYDKQRQLINAAYQCCTEIGLDNGVFNVEMKMISTGPKLVEINGRMGGFYLRDWIKKLYAVDLVMCAFLVSCGIKPYCPELKPKGQFMGFLCIPSLHNHILNDPDTLSRRQELESKRIIHFNQFDEHAVIGKDGFEEPFASIAVMENNISSAKQKLLEIAKDFNITSPAYNIADFLKDFET
ncbi:hypothetical protein ACJMK2_014575 [Sinanodonta woodiana]|uniref:ATP-grasp domain-containing protein n=1 Tax=Sinanodonta woodiana TaxID=1069815 RepID=A0ABD3V1S8_SINWO